LQVPTELEVLQEEVNRLQIMVLQAKRHADGLLLALAFSFLGGVGASAAFSAASGQLLLRGTFIILGSVSVALMTGLWLTRP
jgi:hypothetical protein